MNNFDFIQAYQQRASSLLQQVISGTNTANLQHAMRYSLLAPGKLFRPCLVYATAHDHHVALTDVDGAATAIELIHTYSLIHDDLPAMDDDDTRRGQPSNHKQFDEATAILAGDALLTLAFEQLSSIEQVKVLAHAAGHQGMVGGQAIDLSHSVHSLDDLIQLHQLKTGALIAACLCLVINNPMLHQLGLNIGLAFQIQDDILDITQTSEQLGKPAGSDDKQNKITFVTALGVQGAKQYLNDIEQSIWQQLHTLQLHDGQLMHLVQWMFARSH